MERYPDIEIYLARQAKREAIEAWLSETIGAPALEPAGKLRWRSQGNYQGDAIPVLLVEKAADGFTSLWLDSPATPWATDAELAHAAAAALECEVRCSLGGWHPGDAPDHFLQITADGSEHVIEWVDSGH
ncbi:hypothetical protein [Halomonas halocynthiae]|uniref:hypothetical protein n=1 Tax=Halomonas halocynthiae TaxID=176290 RepID=UPI00041A257D|nr:hypothetical protein [Halomonas halocynthiae]